jgi:hypothetical protein
MSADTVLSKNDTGMLVAGRLRSEDRKKEQSQVFFSTDAKTRETMRGRTGELGRVASMWTLKYAMAISGSTMALKRTRSRL